MRAGLGKTTWEIVNVQKYNKQKMKTCQCKATLESRMTDDNKYSGRAMAAVQGPTAGASISPAAECLSKAVF